MFWLLMVVTMFLVKVSLGDVGTNDANGIENNVTTHRGTTMIIKTVDSTTTRNDTTSTMFPSVKPFTPTNSSNGFSSGSFFGGAAFGMVVLSLCFGTYKVWLKRRAQESGYRTY